MAPFRLSSSRRRRRVRFIIAGVVALAAVAAGTTIGLLKVDAPASRGHTGHGTTTTTTTVPDSTTTTTQPPLTGIGTYTVATTSLVVPVPGAAPTENQVPTTIWYPTAATASARRPFPLLVFSQGFWQAVQSYAVLLHDWASAGFVVAAPAYPHTTPTRVQVSSYTRNDIVHHPADLAAVVTAVAASGQQTGSVLHGLVDSSQLGLVGQSDGGDVSLAAADNSCCRIGSVKAVAVLSGAEDSAFPGQYFPPGTTSPAVLVVQGTQDTINPAGCSVQIFDSVPTPATRYYLNLLGATHLGPYIGSTGWQSTVAKVTTDFFDAELAGEPSGLPAMTADGNVSGTAQLSEGPTAPEPPEACPGAPTGS